MNRSNTLTYSFIILGSIIYGVATVFFVFPSGLFLGGTSGIAVIASSYLPLTAGNVSVVLNVTLLVAAFIVLGRGMAWRTFIGSACTTLSIGAFDLLYPSGEALISNVYISGAVGAALIALASALLFYVDSSSGGTDILALIVRKFSEIKIGKALLITDVLIVVVGGILEGWFIAVASFVCLLIKTLGIDILIRLISNFKPDADKTE